MKREIDDVYEEKNDLNTYKGNKITNKGKNSSANKKNKILNKENNINSNEKNIFFWNTTKKSRNDIQEDTAKIKYKNTQSSNNLIDSKNLKINNDSK